MSYYSDNEREKQQKYGYITVPPELTQEELREHKMKLLIEDPKAKALERLQKEAVRLDLPYEELMDGAKAYLIHWDYIVDGGKYEGESLYKDFWDDYELVTGATVDQDDRGSFFSCSC